MVLQIEPIATAVDSILNSKRKPKLKSKKTKTRTILFSTRGKLFTHKEAQRLSKYDHLIFICGRYEGVDERVAQYIADEELSVGDVVLSGGRFPRCW
jgi:tRNA (guanine37-N1)-methyltransferase